MGILIYEKLFEKNEKITSYLNTSIKIFSLLVFICMLKRFYNVCDFSNKLISKSIRN